ncbi:hypothetical protein DXU93_03785 [Brumimicrobium aurantiacum]|uniref:Uncharacterized protein n=1 Tax=Brumimicrobium aurantiacum TaxID=1737063 RepID=A0A3E1EZF4_9FLAO|nr:hypothetical protein DXU93_03785 [Brumimicrobium aurantiacum]
MCTSQCLAKIINRFVGLSIIVNNSLKYFDLDWINMWFHKKTSTKCTGFSIINFIDLILLQFFLV